jgi:hypothetical protein
MRTTVTLQPDIEASLRRLAAERGISFKEAINSTLRAALGTPSPTAAPFAVKARSMGLRPGVDLDKALRLAGELEDAEIVRKLELRK